MWFWYVLEYRVIVVKSQRQSSVYIYIYISTIEICEKSPPGLTDVCSQLRRIDPHYPRICIATLEVGRGGGGGGGCTHSYTSYVAITCFAKLTMG